MVRERGRNVFHVRFISKSYRIRGRVPRAHRNRNAREVVNVTNIISFKGRLRGVERKSALEIKLIMMMFIYSAMKISAKAPPLYSVLNPETNSDSPSAKSKGVRLVSARVVVNQVVARRGSINVSGVRWLACSLNRLREYIKIRGDRRIRAILTSYEIVWAALRSAPRRAYFELEAQPAISVVYTLNLEIDRNSNTLNGIKVDGFEWGMIDHSIRARNRPSAGAMNMG